MITAAKVFRPMKDNPLSLNLPKIRNNGIIRVANGIIIERSRKLKTLSRFLVRNISNP